MLGSPLGERYQELRERYRKAPTDDVRQKLAPNRAVADPLSFAPQTALYFSRISQELRLTDEEAQRFAEQGVVSIDNEQRFSMGSAYHAIYARDLPLLVTTDSILHALHRSYDQTLKELESQDFSSSLRDVLRETERELVRSRPQLERAGLSTAAEDVALYLGVARRLLEAPESEVALTPRAQELLALIDARSPARVALFGGWRSVDFSQFRARGHYTETPELTRYFHALSWLGRADLGFSLAPAAPGTGLEVDVVRERRDAALLGVLLERAKQSPPLMRVSAAIDYLVGRGDGVTLESMTRALDAAGVVDFVTLADAQRLENAFARLADRGAGQIRSQALVSPSHSQVASAPASFQLFGQRFTPDSFVLSQVVYDAIDDGGHKAERWLPSGLDVMAALGNETAAELLAPELARYHYAPNLLALREALELEVWPAESPSLYVRWLSALRALDDVAEGQQFPEVMRRPAWQRKQLQTQMASWAELRHDTLLHAKQPYTAVPSCGYPAVYVEPYPQFFRGVRELAESAAHFLNGIRAGQAAYWSELGSTLRRLEAISEKELAGAPLGEDERKFLSHTIDATGGSGPPRYTGWYAQLIYRPGWTPSTARADHFGPIVAERDRPDAWRPTVADVHTNPGSDRSPSAVLEAGVGNVQLMIVAIASHSDVTAYVGPISTYYELSVPPESRLDDETWQAKLSSGGAPEHPAWTSVFRAPGLRRQLGDRHRSNGERKRYLEDKLCKLRELARQTPDEPGLPPWQQLIDLIEHELERPSNSPPELPTDAMLDARLEALDRRPFDSKLARERLLAQAAALRAACGREPLRAQVRFRADGSVQRVDVPGASAALASCAARILGRTWAPRFGGADASIEVTFSAAHRSSRPSK